MTGPAASRVVRSHVAAALRPRPVCPDTAVLFDAFCADSRAREAAHVDRIRAEARRLGRLVAAHEVTIADARARLAHLVDLRDPTSLVEVRRAPYAIGRLAAADAFARGMSDAQPRVAS